MTNTGGPDCRRPPSAAELLVTSLLADATDDDAAEGASDDRARAATRSRLLSAARDRARDAVLPHADDLPVAARPYRTQVAEWSALVTGPAATSAVVVVNGWDAAQTLGHLLAVDALAAGALGLPSPPETGTGQDVAERTASVHALYAGRGLDAVAGAWRAQAVALLRHAQAGGEARLAQAVVYLDLPVTAGDILLDRAFETWVHAEDLRASLALAPAAPPVEHVAQLTELGVRMLPFTLQLTRPAPSADPLMLELTGPGGSAWVVSPAGSRRAVGPPPAGGTRVWMDAVDFCHLAGGRVSPGHTPHAFEGDPEEASGVLAAAAALARL